MIADAIECFLTPITVRRTNEATTYVNGLAQVVTNVDEFCLEEASVQPVGGRERLVLPELIRDREMKKIYTACELLSVDVQGKKRADRITYKGKNYVVQTVIDWDDHGGYFKVLMVKENE